MAPAEIPPMAPLLNPPDSLDSLDLGLSELESFKLLSVELET